MSYDPVDAIGLLRSYSRHRDFVRLAMHKVSNALEERAIEHDASKLLDDEFDGFSRINKTARVQKFGSEEYKQSMKDEKPTISLHFSRNSHHPECIGIPHQTALALPNYTRNFLDIIEMVCDWWGARKGYDDSRSWLDSVKLNLESKGKYLTQEQRWLAEEVAKFLGEKENEKL